MELNEVLDFIKSMDKAELGAIMPKLIEHHNLFVVLSEPSIGPTAATRLKSGMSGFDWDSGRFLLFPEDEVTKKDPSPVLFRVEFLLKEARKSAEECKGTPYDEGFYAGKEEALKQIMAFLK